MELVVHDTVSVLEPHFTSADRPSLRIARIQETLLAPGGLLRRLQGVARDAEAEGLGVARAAALDGYDALWAQQMWGLFDASRTVAASAWQFARFREKGVLEMTRRCLEDAASALGASAPSHVQVFIMPLDPAKPEQ